MNDNGAKWKQLMNLDKGYMKVLETMLTTFLWYFNFKRCVQVYREAIQVLSTKIMGGISFKKYFFPNIL